MLQTVQKELPPRYYLTYFEYLLSFIKDKYESLLLPREHEFITGFSGLSEEARCLFVRFTNRRSDFFRIEKLDYQEIGSIEAALDELLDHRFAELLCADHCAAAPELLNIYTREELLACLPVLQPGVKKPSKLKKPELLDYFLQTIPFEDLQTYFNSKEKIIKKGFTVEVEFLRFLFFGNIYDDMTQFVIRDLGNARFETYDDSKLTPYFKSRREAEDKLHITKAYQFFKDLRDADYPAEDIFNWFVQWSAQHPVESTIVMPTYDKMALKLAALLEKKQLPGQALRAYQYTNKPPSRERQVRLLHKAGFLAEALILCKKMAEFPFNAEEEIFALDFTRRQEKKGSVKSTTRHLNEAEAIKVDVSFKYQVERGVIDYFEQRGDKAMISENYLWRSLFGLLLWDVVFDEEAAAIHQPFQRTPSDLYSPDFFEKRKKRLTRAFDGWKDATDLKAQVEKTYREKLDVLNPLVGWHESLLPLATACCEKLEVAQIKSVLLEMAQNLKENSRGFPDLFMWNDLEYCFIEVKSPTDSLSAQQLYWLQFFKRIGIKAKVLKVEWSTTDL